jgi:hypothetical protein
MLVLPELIAICVRPVADSRPFLANYNPSSIECAGLIGAHLWLDLGCDGLVIVHYMKVHDDSLFGADEEYQSSPDENEFWHLRTLSHRTGIPMWRDHTQYRGATVPRDILQRVYDIAERDPESIQGGRRMMLGQAEWDGPSLAWRVLENWWSAQNPSLTEEDELGDWV